MAEDRQAKAADEARRDLERMRGDGDFIGASALARAAERARGHFSAADAPQNDPVEIWGRRIARVLAAVFVLFLLWWLVGYLLA